MRYIVISFGCLECGMYPYTDIAEVVLKTDDLEAATTSASEDPYPGQEKRLLVDTLKGEILNQGEEWSHKSQVL